MSMHWLDWTIVVGFAGLMTLLAYSTKKYTQSVADFLAASRCAGRYLLGIAQDMAGTGAISIVANMQMMFIAGFTAMYWSWMSLPVGLFISLTGFVIYRYRATRALTLAQFFEMRYSRKFRIFAGLIAYLAGIVNFGIFPAVGARFFIYFCGLPPHPVHLGPLVLDLTFVAVMVILLTIALSFTLMGGQSAVMVTDFAQGMLCNVLFVVILIYAMSYFTWDQIGQALRGAPPDASLVHPFHTSNLESFNYWYFLMGVLIQIYGFMSWQGSSGYRCAAKSPHEAKMAGILGQLRGFGLMLLVAMLPICAYTIMHLPDFAPQARSVNAALDRIQLQGKELQQVQSQMRVPLAVRQFLPVGLVGAFAAILFAAFLTTHDTYMHSWGSIFVQDVILPFRKTPLGPEQHLRYLRGSIIGVAVFIFFFSLIFRQTEHILLFFMITGAIFINGAGAAIIGGLYWKRGTAAGAWAAMIVGSTTAVAGILLRSFMPEAFPVGPLVLTFGTMALAAATYVGVSLAGIWASVIISALLWATALVLYFALAGGLAFAPQQVSLFAAGLGAGIAVIAAIVGPSPPVNMDRILHRGKYAVKEDQARPKRPSGSSIWKWLGMGPEFSFTDKLIYLGASLKTFVLFGIFTIALVINLASDVSFDSWFAFWKGYIYVFVILAVAFTVWFTVGGIMDIRYLYAALKTLRRDARDDGTVIADEPPQDQAPQPLGPAAVADPDDGDPTS